MERVIKTIVCLTSLLMASTTFAGVWDEWTFKPILGGDINTRSQDFEAGFGKDHFRRRYPDTNLYAGLIMNKYLGLEGGYEHMYLLYKNRFYTEGTLVLGTDRLFDAGDQNFNSYAYMSGWHLNLVGLWPVCPNIAITASIGAAWLRMRFETVYVADGDPASRPTQWESDNRAVTRVTLGVRQMITQHFGMRVQGAWENTSKLEASIPLPVDIGNPLPSPSLANNYTVHPKDSYTIGIGAFLQLA